MIVEFNKYYLDQITATEDKRLEEELASSFVKSIHFLGIPITFIECPALSIT